MTKEKENFDAITPSIIFAQLFKSRNTMEIVHLKTESLSVYNTSKVYYETITKLIIDLVKVNSGISGKKQIDDCPSSKYIDPTLHLNDIHYYLSRHKTIFRTQEELNIIEDILRLISKTKVEITLQ